MTEKTYLFNFRMTHVQLEYVSDKISETGFLKDSILQVLDFPFCDRHLARQFADGLCRR